MVLLEHPILLTTQESPITTGSIVVIVVSALVVIALSVLAVFVRIQREVQPLKIKSPTLLFVFLIANIAFVALICLIQINAEVCQTTCDQGLEDTAKTSGYLLVCLVEPLLLISYMFRFLRIKRIFDA
jgi:hypothetical protein